MSDRPLLRPMSLPRTSPRCPCLPVPSYQTYESFADEGVLARVEACKVRSPPALSSSQPASHARAPRDRSGSSSTTPSPAIGSSSSPCGRRCGRAGTSRVPRCAPSCPARRFAARASCPPLCSHQHRGAHQSDEWKEVGFQSADPLSDLRAAGLLGVVHLNYLCTNHREFVEARSLRGLLRRVRYTARLTELSSAPHSARVSCRGTGATRSPRPHSTSRTSCSAS